MGGTAAPVINPANASAEKVRETPGLSERRDTCDKGKACPNDSDILREGRRSGVGVPRQSARIWIGWNRYISFILAEGQTASPTIIPSLTYTNELYNLAVTCPHEIQLTLLVANTLGGQRGEYMCARVVLPLGESLVGRRLLCGIY